MRQFDVHINASGRLDGLVPYLIVLQADLLRHLDLVVVAPLWKRSSFGQQLNRLHLQATIGSEAHVLEVNGLASLERRMLGERVANLEAQRHEIIGALDFLFTGV